ncbi:hypothetical protein PTKIN_Ptkin03bG0121000 [Pterospermum kingtungense]
MKKKKASPFSRKQRRTRKRTDKDAKKMRKTSPHLGQPILAFLVQPPGLPFRTDNKDFIERSLVDSERVQMEDIALCEGVQRGIESPAYCSGRYAPTVEKAMHHFHCLLYDNLIS